MPSAAPARTVVRELSVATGADDPERLADELVLLYEGATVLGGLAITAEPAGTARSLAVLALERAGCAPVRSG